MMALISLCAPRQRPARLRVHLQLRAPYLQAVHIPSRRAVISHRDDAVEVVHEHAADLMVQAGGALAKRLRDIHEKLIPGEARAHQNVSSIRHATSHSIAVPVGRTRRSSKSNVVLCAGEVKPFFSSRMPNSNIAEGIPACPK